MNRDAEIAIIGGGIGGLATAIALRQKGFHNITIYERRSSSSFPGAGFVLWANASWILDRLNLLAKVARVGVPIKQMERWTQEGDFLGSLDINIINEVIGYPSYAIRRSDFLKILENEVARYKIKIQKSTAISFIVDAGKEAGRLQLENGTTQEADIIVGADGRMRSVARSYVNENNSPIYQNYINWIGMLDNSSGIDLKTESVLDYWGVGARFGIVPVRGQKLYWAGCIAAPRSYQLTESTDKAELLCLFKNWPGWIKDIILNTNPNSIKRIPVYDHDPIERWYKNNVCLIGDAAHAAPPTSGQGACQALEDAWHLANQLASFNSIETCYQAYEHARIPKTTSITRAGREFASSLFSIDKDRCIERNLKAKNTDYQSASLGIAQLWKMGLH